MDKFVKFLKSFICATIWIVLQWLSELWIFFWLPNRRAWRTIWYFKYLYTPVQWPNTSNVDRCEKQTPPQSLGDLSSFHKCGFLSISILPKQMQITLTPISFQRNLLPACTAGCQHCSGYQRWWGEENHKVGINHNHSFLEWFWKRFREEPAEDQSHPESGYLWWSFGHGHVVPQRTSKSVRANSGRWKAVAAWNGPHGSGWDWR